MTDALKLARDALADLIEAADSMRGTYGCVRGETPEDDDTNIHDKWAEDFLSERTEQARAAIAAADAALTAQEPVAPKFLFVAMDDDKVAHLTYCANEAEVRAALTAAMFWVPAGEELRAEHADELQGNFEELMDAGGLSFEGDPPVHLYRLPPAQPVAAPAQPVADPWTAAVAACLERIDSTLTIQGESPEKLKQAIRARVADVAKPTFAQPVAGGDLRNAKWLDPECYEAGACQSLKFKCAQPVAGEQDAPPDEQGRGRKVATLALLKMDSAPRDGTRFTFVRIVTTVGGAKPSYQTAYAQTMWRKKSSPESAGYWATEATSVADHDAEAGYWIPLWGVDVLSAARGAA